MRLVSLVLGLSLLLASRDADAYARVPRSGAFGTYLTSLASAARRHDARGLRRLSDRELSIGEEIVIDPARMNARQRRVLVDLVQRGACYRISRAQIQCELPDPGPNLDHTKLPRSSIAMFAHTRHGWRLVALYE